MTIGSACQKVTTEIREIACLSQKGAIFRLKQDDISCVDRATSAL